MKILNLIGYLLIIMLVTADNDIENNYLSTDQQYTSSRIAYNLGEDSKDIQILQKVFKGFFQQNNLYEPASIKYCFSDQSAHSIVVFIGQSMNKAASSSLKDLIQLISLVKSFVDKIDDDTFDCLEDCPEMQSIGHKYNLDIGSSPEEAQLTVVLYITYHFLQVHNWAIDLDMKWKTEQYYEYGFKMAQILHKIFY